MVFLVFLSSCVKPASPLYHAGLPLSRKVIAVLPFENLSEQNRAAEELMPHVRTWFATAGFDMVPEAAICEFLLVHEVRNIGRFPGVVIEQAGRDLGVDYVLLGSINSLSDEPSLSVSARLISVRDGTVVWGGNSSRSGEEFKTALGVGKITKEEDLIAIVLDDLFSSLKQFVPRGKEAAGHHFRVAILPLENLSARNKAGLVVMYLLLSALPQETGWEAVDYGQVWTVLVAQNYPYRGSVDYDTLQALGNALDVDGILLGTVQEYKEAGRAGRKVVPEVSFGLRMLHVPTKTIVYADQMAATGEDNLLLFDWGRIRTAGTLAQKMVEDFARHLPRAEVR